MTEWFKVEHLSCFISKKKSQVRILLYSKRIIYIRKSLKEKKKIIENKIEKKKEK
jgi:hypothetical protein